MRAQARAIAQTYSGAANQATEAWVGPVFGMSPDAWPIWEPPDLLS